MSTRHRAAIYARASTFGQTVESQFRELREVAARNGWFVVAEFTDHGISGSKGRDRRPTFDQLLRGATRREFDIVMVWAIDRLGRSVQHLVGLMNKIQGLGIDLYVHQQAINTRTPAGRMIFRVFSALGEYEREQIRGRIITGQQRAKAEGSKIGRPSKMHSAVKTSVLLLREKGLSVRQIAKRLEIGFGTTDAIIKAAA